MIPAFLFAIMLGQLVDDNESAHRLVACLRNPLIQKELQIPDAISARIAELDQKAELDRIALGRKLPPSAENAEERVELLSRIAVQVRNDACALLTDSQRKRLAQIYAQEVGWERYWTSWLVLSPIGLKDLRVGDSQRAAIEAKSRDYHLHLSQALKSFDDDVEALRIQYQRECLNILSEKQAESYRKYFGDCFAFGEPDEGAIASLLQSVGKTEKTGASKQ